MLRTLFLLVALSTFAVSLPINDNAHHVHKRLPSTWFHPEDHPVHALFKRAPGDGINYAPVGSPEWSRGFPAYGSAIASQLPKPWTDALAAAVAAGKIPDIPPSSGTNVYPQGLDPAGPTVCSATSRCRIPGDVWDAPAGVFASSFDDGPLPPTTNLVHFLQQQNKTTTHFMIGVNIIQNPTQFLTAFDAGHDIAVHTWTHPHMTALSNLDVVAQLGWTSELIMNSTGGRVPRFWRPPYGDSDRRISAIAKEIFGLTTVLWNQDTADWSLTTGGTTPERVHAALQQFLTGPKSPGLVVLEHELTDQSVQAFIEAYPLIQSNGWNFLPVSSTVNGSDSYQNAHDSSSNVTLAGGILAGQMPTAPPPSSQSSSSVSPTSTTLSASSITPTTTSAGAPHRGEASLNIAALAIMVTFIASLIS